MLQRRFAFWITIMGLIAWSLLYPLFVIAQNADSPATHTVEKAKKIRQEILDGKRSGGSTAKPRKLKKSDPEYQDIQDALDVLDKMGYKWVRKCINELLADDNITLDPTLGSKDALYWGFIAEELYLKIPDIFPSHMKSDIRKANTERDRLRQRADVYNKLVKLAGALLHECLHRQKGLANRALNIAVGKVMELSAWSDWEEGFTHLQEFMFYYYLYNKAWEVTDGVECKYLWQLLQLMSARIFSIQEKYTPFYALSWMQKIYYDLFSS